MQDNPGHQRFTALRHPLARAHAAFCDKILNTGPGSFAKIRQQLARFHDLDLPEDANDPGYGPSAHKAAFEGFLRFLRANLNGQTSIRVDAHWASQVACLQGMSEFCLPDRLLREDDLPDALPQIAAQLGVTAPPEFNSAPDANTRRLSQIYDQSLDQLCRDAYPRDYTMFGFSDFRMPA